MFCQEFTNGLIRGPIYRRSLDLDLVAPVRKFNHAFAFTPGMHLDIYSHRQLGQNVSLGNRASHQLFLHALVVFHGRQKLFLAPNQGSAANKIVCT